MNFIFGSQETLWTILQNYIELASPAQFFCAGDAAYKT